MNLSNDEPAALGDAIVVDLHRGGKVIRQLTFVVDGVRIKPEDANVWLAGVAAMRDKLPPRRRGRPSNIGIAYLILADAEAGMTNAEIAEKYGDEGGLTTDQVKKYKRQARRALNGGAEKPPK